jgi:hypothetical protein
VAQQNSPAGPAQQTRFLPQNFKTYTPFPFAGMNQQDAPTAIDDKEFTYVENFVRLGNGQLRTVWDVGPGFYQAPPGLTIVSFYFYNIGSVYYVVVFLSDGSAVQLDAISAVQTAIGGPGSFYNSANGILPATSQWGVQYLLISNRNTQNDYWSLDGSTIYTAGTSAPNGVTLTSGGSGYSSPPTVTAYGGQGSGMTFTPTVKGGSVVQVQIDNPGSGYQVGDTVQLHFSGGGSDDAAILMAGLSSGGVAAINVTAPGSGYTIASATISGGGGSGANAIVQIGTGVSGVTITNPGANYTTATVSFSGGGGTGAVGEVDIVGGQIADVQIINPGTGYTSAPTVTITGDGTGATATATINTGQISAINVTAPGSGYTSAPTVTITGDGTGATAQAVLGGAGINQVTVVDGGSNFTSAPNISFVGGGGSGASGTAVLVPTSIARIDVVNGGQNYNRVPKIVLTGGGGGSGASAHAVISKGQVIQIIVDNPGSGYTTNVNCQILPVVINSKTGERDGGTGAGGVVVFAPTSIASVLIGSYGSGYTDAPAVVVEPGANNAAAGNVDMMPFGVSGAAMETFQQRVWLANPCALPYGNLPPGGNWIMTAPGSLTDFATSDGGIQFTNSDGFLQTRYTAIHQSNGYLYFFGDGSVSVVSNVATSGNPSTTTFNYQNVDPQTGVSWRASLQDFGRTVVGANETGIYGLYGGAMTKISAKLDQFFNLAIFPPIR